MPLPLTETPTLKKRAWAANRAESGNSRMANGSSNDSSISLMVIELFRLKGGLCQSNSIKRCKVYPSPIHCLYNVFTHLRAIASTGNSPKDPDTVELECPLTLPALQLGPSTQEIGGS